MKILIVEDEVLIREGMSDYLMECGYEVFEAGDGQEALDLFHREAPDLVLLDINMPGLNGLQALEKIKSQDYRFRAVFSTAYDYFEYAVEALRLGAVDFMVKPVKK